MYLITKSDIIDGYFNEDSLYIPNQPLEIEPNLGMVKFHGSVTAASIVAGPGTGIEAVNCMSTWNIKVGTDIKCFRELKAGTMIVAGGNIKASWIIAGWGIGTDGDIEAGSIESGQEHYVRCKKIKAFRMNTGWIEVG